MASTSLENDILDGSVIREALESGADLREYSSKVEKELLAAEEKSVLDYIKESDNIVELRDQINDCDSVLQRMESMLQSFKCDLGNISGEILSLRSKSVEMSVNLNNTQALKADLQQFVEDIYVSEDLIDSILEDPVTDDSFVKAVDCLCGKIAFEKEQRALEVKACQDVKVVLEKLKIKAVTKTRAYFLEQIAKMKKPMANYQVIQSTMLKYKKLFQFLLTNEIATANEVVNEYATTVSKIYYSYFKSYSSSIAKLAYEDQATKYDLLASEEGSASGGGWLHAKSSSLTRKNTIFTIGNRGNILTVDLEAPIIIPHSASQRYPFEALFRSEQYAILDNGCREYTFLVEFFNISDKTVSSMFDQCMDKVLNLLASNLESSVLKLHDPIALYLCVQIVNRYRLFSHKRAVPVLDDYWNRIERILWHRFRNVFEQNLSSVKNCDPLKYGSDTRPHYVTRRYAEFSCTIMSINDAFPIDEVATLLDALLDEVQCFLLKLASVFARRREQLVFLINNYDVALAVFTERGLENSRAANCLKNLISARSSDYVEEMLSPHFGAVMQFVKDSETAVEKNDTQLIKHLEKNQHCLVKSLASSWKSSLENLNSEVLSSFPSLVTGSSLLQLAFAQFINYFHRFNKLLAPTAKGQLPNVHLIMVELKKFKTNI